MADKVYPSNKPPQPPAAATTANPAFPATKSQLYGANRPAYRPQRNRKRTRSGCSCCACFLWTTIIILILIFLAAIAGVIFYVIYRPHRPTFTVTGLKVNTLNLTSKLTTNINVNISARNPNTKLVYYYNPTTILVETNGVAIGTGSLPAFVHGTKNTTMLKVPITNNGNNQELDDVTSGKLKSAFKNKNGLPLNLQIDTKVKAKAGGLKSPKIGIRVTCEGIKVKIPSGKSATTGSVANVKCKVDVRIKIWRWTL